MRYDGRSYRLVVECLGRGRAAHPPAALEAGVLGDGALRIRGAVRKQFAYRQLRIITRDDVGKPRAYKGMPLYLWAKDQKPGDKTGDGFNNLWHVAKP
jgi:predicted lipoprotein with Yx(FWY)xxD motif